MSIHYIQYISLVTFQMVNYRLIAASAEIFFSQNLMSEMTFSFSHSSAVAIGFNKNFAAFQNLRGAFQSMLKDTDMASKCSGVLTHTLLFWKFKSSAFVPFSGQALR